MKNSLTYLLILTFCLSACSGFKKDNNFKKGNNGILYKLIEDNNTPEIGKVAFVALTYTEVTSTGKPLAATGRFDPRPAHIFATMPEFKGDFQSALQYLSEGDSAIIKIKSDSVAYRIGALKNDTSKYIIYTVRVNKVINRKGEVDTTYAEQIKNFERDDLINQKASEEDKIKRYLAVNKLNYKQTAGGIAYPSGLAIANNTGKALRVNYTLSSLDGKVYDTNNEPLAKMANIYRPYKLYKPYQTTPEQASFPGFKEVLKMIPSGSKTRFIIPSALAFGIRGNNTGMPAFCPLICEVEIL